jgi:cytidyltransferase-like protein
MIKTGIVFGVFDGLHEGHKHFLSEAQKRCEALIVVVTRPEMVKKLKGKNPTHSFDARLADIKKFNPSLVVAEGDAALGEWAIFKKHNPDMVFLGHDQHAILSELEKLSIPYLFIDAHYPDKYKSSILNN